MDSEREIQEKKEGDGNENSNEKNLTERTVASTICAHHRPRDSMNGVVMVETVDFNVQERTVPDKTGSEQTATVARTVSESGERDGTNGIETVKDVDFNVQERAVLDNFKGAVHSVCVRNKGPEAPAVNMHHGDDYIFYSGDNSLYCKGIRKANFYISIVSIYAIYSGKSNECIDTCFDLELHVFPKIGPKNVYPIKNIRQEDVLGRGFLNKYPGAVTFCTSASETTNFIYQYFSYLIYTCNIQPFYKYVNSGWQWFHGLRLYVDSNGAVGHPEIKVKANSELGIMDRFRAEVFPEFCRMTGIIRERWKAMGLLLYVMMQVLHTIFEDADFVPKFSLFVSGPRGCRKTAVCQCMTQLVNKSSPAINFLATESGIQNQLSKYQDQCMLIDDLAPTPDGAEKKRKEKMLEMVLRLFGDSGERVINPNFTPGAAEKTDYSVHGGVVLTGEYFYSTGSESSIARAVVIELDHDSVDLELLTYFQNNHMILESLLYRLIAYVTENYEGVLQIIRNEVLYYREYARQFQFTNDRYADYLGQYMAVGHIAADMFRTESQLSGDQYHQLIRDIEKEIAVLLLENNEKMKQRNPISIILGALLYALNCGKVGMWGTPFGENVRIVCKDDIVYFRQMDLSDITREYCQKMNVPYLRMSSIEIGKILDNSGLFQRNGSDNRLGKRYVTVYGTERLIDISLDGLKKYGENYHVDF